MIQLKQRANKNTQKFTYNSCDQCYLIGLLQPITREKGPALCVIPQTAPCTSSHLKKRSRPLYLRKKSKKPNLRRTTWCLIQKQWYVCSKHFLGNQLVFQNIFCQFIKYMTALKFIPDLYLRCIVTGNEKSEN